MQSAILGNFYFYDPLTRRDLTMGIRDRPISLGSPWQKRLIGTVPRRCRDRVLIFDGSDEEAAGVGDANEATTRVG
jgi:hypothetical protein